MAAQSFGVSKDVHIRIRGCRERVSVTGSDQAYTVFVSDAAFQQGDAILVEQAARVTVSVPATAAVTVSDCEADVRVEGVSGPVVLERIRGNASLSGLAGVVVRDQAGDLAVRHVATLRGEGTWQGDVSLSGIAGSAEIDHVLGDACVDDAAAVSIGRLDGDLSARSIRGALRLGDVTGDVSMNDVAGDVNLAHGRGDLIAQELRGALDAAEVGGDAVVSVDRLGRVVVRARGDVVLNLPEDANANVEVRAPRGEWVVRAGMRIAAQDDHWMRGTLGRGGERVDVESVESDVVLRAGNTTGPRFEFAAEIDAPFAEMGQEMAAMGRRLAREVHQSVEESLVRAGIYGRRRYYAYGWPGEPALSMHTAPADAESTAGAAERKAILDAIARGELSVDDAIRKLGGQG